MAISTPPSLPERNKSGFSDLFSAWLTWFNNTFQTEFNAAIAAFNFNSTTDSSATSNTIGTGAKTFTVSAGKSFIPGMFLVIADTAAPSTNNMFCQVTSYSGTSLVVNVISVIGSGTKTAWTISQSAAGGASGNAVAGLLGNSFGGAQNVARATVASSASTSDIWAALGNQIDWTGTATTTGFPAAPQAGAMRRLICAGACSLTAGANLLVNGTASGNTVTLGAGDVIDVEAITTTQFKATITKYNGAPVSEKIAILGSYRNLAVFNNGATPNSKVDLTASEFIVKDAGNIARILSSVSVTADIAAAVGANALDAGTEAVSTWYYLWVIYNPTTGTTASLLSTSSTAPTLPSGYTFKALAGAIYNDGTSNFIKYRQVDNEFWVGEVAAMTTTVPGTSYVSISLATAVPPNARAAKISGQWQFSASATGVNYYAPSNADDLAQMFNETTGGSTAVTCNDSAILPLITAQTIYYKRTGTAATSGNLYCSGGKY